MNKEEGIWGFASSSVSLKLFNLGCLLPCGAYKIPCSLSVLHSWEELWSRKGRPQRQDINSSFWFLFAEDYRGPDRTQVHKTHGKDPEPLGTDTIPGAPESLNSRGRVGSIPYQAVRL